MAAHVVCSCDCSAKFSGFDASIAHMKKFKTAKVQGVRYDDGRCAVRIILACAPTKYQDFIVWNGRKSDVKNVTTQAGRIFVDFKDYNLHLHVNAPKFKGCLTQLSVFLKTAQSGKYKPSSSNGQSNILVDSVKEPNQSLASQSSPPFTSVKEKPNDDIEISGRSKINASHEDVTPPKVQKSFLASAEEKCARFQSKTPPASTSPVKFYRNVSKSVPRSLRNPFLGDKKTPTQVRQKPRLLDLPNNRAASILNNSINYSWQGKHAHSTQKENKPSHSSGLGFSNLGNTCYMNAILQSLFGLNTFVRDLTALAVRLKKEPNLHTSLAYEIAKLHDAKRRQVSRDSQKQCLARIKSSISSTARRFSGNDQHDAHELLSQVLDQIKEDVQRQNKVFQKRLALQHDTQAHTDPDNFELAPEAPQTDIHDVTKDEFINPALLNFEFEVMHTITCLKCKGEVKKTETFHDLSLELPKRRNADETSTIQDALDQFFQSEKIEYTCESCGHKEVTVGHQFYRLPRVLVLHLKRYQFNSTFTSQRKLRRDIDIPLYLSLFEHTSEQTYPPYDLDIKHNHRNFSADSVVMMDEDKQSNRFQFHSSKGSSSRTLVSVENKPSNRDGLEKEKPVASRTPLREKSQNNQSHLRNALLNDSNCSNQLNRNNNCDNEPKAAAPDKPNTHDQTFTEQDMAEYTMNLSEDEQMKRALEMSMQDAGISTSELSNAQSDNSQLVQDRSNNDSPKKEVFSTELFKCKTPENEMVKTYTKKRKIGSRVFSEENENQEPRHERKKSRTSLEFAERTTPLSKSSHTLTANGSDMLSALETEEQQSTPQKTDVNSVPPRSSFTPRRLDEIFGTNAATAERKSAEHARIGSQEKPEVMIDLTNLEDTFQKEMCNRPQDLNSTPVRGFSPNSGRNSHIPFLNDTHDHMYHTDDEAIVNDILHTDMNDDDNLVDSNVALDSKDSNSVLETKQLNLSVTKTSHKGRKGGRRHVKITADGSKVVDTDVISQYFQDGQDNSKNASGIELSDSEDDAKNDSHQHHSMKIPRQSLDPSYVPRLSDTCFDEEDENANVKATPTKEEQSAARSVTKDHNTSKVDQSTGVDLANYESTDKQAADTRWETDKEKEEADLQQALQKSIIDQGEFDDELRKAIELSLKDLDNGGGWEEMQAEEESFLREQFERSEEEHQRRKRNLETGEMPYSYRLVSVVSHLGSSNSGHYMSDVYSGRAPAWYSYDDSHVTSISEQCVRNNRKRTGYIFFYVYKDIQTEIESRLPRSPGSKENVEHVVATPASSSRPQSRSILGSHKPREVSPPRQRPVSR